MDRRPVHPNLLAFLLGAHDPHSAVSKLNGHGDVLAYIWTLVKHSWAMDLFRANINRGSQRPDNDVVAFAHVEDVLFPDPAGRHVNMMPFILGDKSSLPDELAAYWPMIQTCVETLVNDQGAKVAGRRRHLTNSENEWKSSAIGYLTIHESDDVAKGSSQRRPGLHTEGFVREPCDAGVVVHEPFWHGWGFGRCIGKGRFQGGIFMASNVNTSCRVYNTLVPDELVGKGGDIEHLRTVLNEGFPEKPQPRFRRRGEHAAQGDGLLGTGCAVGPAHYMDAQGEDGRTRWTREPVRGPIDIQAGELFWMTDRTPHESLPLPDGGARQFFRLVTSNIDTWYAQHSTPNPLGILPEAKVVTYDKFTGRERAVDSKDAAAVLDLTECRIGPSDPPPNSCVNE